jgi:hypothetical protein
MTIARPPFATAFALLRGERHVVEVGLVRGPMAAIVEGAELRKMMAELAAARGI